MTKGEIGDLRKCLTALRNCIKVIECRTYDIRGHRLEVLATLDDEYRPYFKAELDAKFMGKFLTTQGVLDAVQTKIKEIKND